jgi:hypothetical protein
MSKNKSWFTIERITIIVLLIILLLLQQCHKACPKEPWEIVKTTIKTYRDTVTQIKTDTVVRYVTLKVPKPTPDPQDTILSVYTQEHSDSSLDATFINKVDGVLVSSDFKYKLKVPKEILKTITQVDTITNTVTNTVKVNRNVLAVGGLLLGSQTAYGFDAGVGISFYHKKGYLYQVNYLPLSKTVVIGFAYQLNRDYD